MPKKCIIRIDGKELSVNDTELSYLEFLTTCGFMRSIEPGYYLSNPPSLMAKSLNPSFISTPLPSTEGSGSNGFSVGRESVLDAAQPLISYLNQTRKLAVKTWQILLLETSISLFEYFLTLCASNSRSLRSELRALASLEECDLDQTDSQVPATAADSNQTEGSHFEEVMNDLTLVDTPVKRKRKKASITNEKVSDEKRYSDQIMSTAIKWHEWASKKMPWMKEKITAEKFYNELIKIQQTVDLNDSGIDALFEFIKNDEFWSQNAISPMNLNSKSKNGLRKIDNILLRMKKRIASDNPFYEIDSGEWQNPFS
jgi:hypothetical protein